MKDPLHSLSALYSPFYIICLISSLYLTNSTFASILSCLVLYLLYQVSQIKWPNRKYLARVAMSTKKPKEKYFTLSLQFINMPIFKLKNDESLIFKKCSTIIMTPIFN